MTPVLFRVLALVASVLLLAGCGGKLRARRRSARRQQQRRDAIRDRDADASRERVPVPDRRLDARAAELTCFVPASCAAVNVLNVNVSLTVTPQVEGTLTGTADITGTEPCSGCFLARAESIPPKLSHPVTGS